MPGFLTQLSAGDLRAAGVPEPWSFGIADRVRFSEIDALGHVNHTVYLRWFESLRVDYLGAYGLSRYAPGDMQVVLKSVSSQFHAPLHLGDEYVVTARTVSLRNASFRMVYGVWKDELAVEGDALIVCLENDLRTKRPLTAQMRQTLIERDGAIQES